MNFEEIKEKVSTLRRFMVANKEAPTLEMSEWLIKEVEDQRIKRNQCEETIASLVAECKRQNIEIERLSTENKLASVTGGFNEDVP